MADPYNICADLYGECRCAAAGRPACDEMVRMADDGENADDERERMKTERDAASVDDF